uniref:Cytochrome P450 77A3 n=1 Tax=Ananas comosus var. bracteatus TaxID=296719 RepID=A0A6V7QV22_ANACO
MDASDLLFLVGAALLAALWWRRCCSRAGGDAGDGLPRGLPGGPWWGTCSRWSWSGGPSCTWSATSAPATGPSSRCAWGSAPWWWCPRRSSSTTPSSARARSSPPARPTPHAPPLQRGQVHRQLRPLRALWRALRRNFVAEIVSPARVRSFGWIRDWAIAAHLARLREQQSRLGAAQVMGACRLTVCSILACICFGARVPEPHVREIEEVLKDVMMMTTPKLPDFLPVLTPLFRGQLTAARALRRRQLDCLLPLVRARRAFVGDENRQTNWEMEMEMVSPAGDAYVDSLFGLDPAGRGRLGEEELVTLCSEVMSAGTDTSATALEWALLHLVLDPAAQERLHAEVVAKAGPRARAARSRRPTSRTCPTCRPSSRRRCGATRPATSSSPTPSPRTRPSSAGPERVDGARGVAAGAVPGRRGRVGHGRHGDARRADDAVRAGRRICPAATLGMLHVQLMLANMVREFRWTPAPGDQPDPTETFAFTVVMKNPLRAAIIEREQDNCTTAI